MVVGYKYSDHMLVSCMVLVVNNRVKNTLKLLCTFLAVANIAVSIVQGTAIYLILLK